MTNSEYISEWNAKTGKFDLLYEIGKFGQVRYRSLDRVKLFMTFEQRFDLTCKIFPYLDKLTIRQMILKGMK